jgi:RimJ/RimL family protein N-acetyltransferase
MILAVLLVLVLIIVVLRPLHTSDTVQIIQIPQIRKIDNFNPTKIQLQPITISDAPYIYQICGDVKNAKYYTINHRPWTAERVYDYIDSAVGKINERKIVSEFGDFIGITGYNPDYIDTSKNFIHIIIAPAYHRSGVATHAYSKLLKLYFENSNNNIIYSRIHKDNIPSIKLHEKIGFEYKSAKQNNDDYRIYMLARSSFSD